MAFSDIVLRIRAQNNASGGLNSLGNDFRHLSSVITSAAGVATAALGGMSAAFGAQEISRAGMAFESYRAALGSVTDSSEKAEAVLNYLKKTSNDLGLNMEASTEQFTLLSAAAKGTSLQGAQTMEIFEGISMAMTALGRSTDDTSGALNAIQQMISKGKVSSEELKEQLGERLPGAFQIAARSMGMTTDALFKALEDGKVKASDLIPKLAAELKKQYGDAAAAAAEGVRANVNRMQNAFTQLSDTVFKSGFGDSLNAQLKGVIQTISGPGADELGKSLGYYLGSAVTAVGDAAAGMKSILSAGVQVAKELNSELGIVDKMKAAFSGLSSVASSAANNLDLVKAAIVGLAAAKATSTILTMSAALVGLLAALNSVTLAIGAVVAGVGVAAAAIYAFRDSTVAFGDQQVTLGSIVSGTWTTISEAVTSRFNDIVSAFSSVSDYIKGVFSQTATDADGKFSVIGAAIELAKNNFSTFVDGTKKGFEIVLGVIEYVKVGFRELAASIATLDFDRLSNVGSVASAAFGSQQGIIDSTIASWKENVAQAQQSQKAVEGVTDATKALAVVEKDRAAQGEAAMKAANAAIEAALKNPSGLSGLNLPGISVEQLQSATLTGKAARPPDPSMIDPKLLGSGQTITPQNISQIASSFPSLSTSDVRTAAASALGAPVVTPSGPDEEAVKAAEKELRDYQRRLERLTDSLLPAKARSLEFKQAQTDLSRALKDGKISQEEYNQMTAQAQELLGSGSTVVAQALRDLDEQGRLLGVSSKARETEAAVLQLENEAKRDGIKLTAEEISLYREKFAALRQQEIDADFAERQKDRVAALREEISMVGMRGDALERQRELFSVMAEAENAGVSDATAAVKEYMGAYDELKAKELEAKSSIMGGIREALYDQVEAAQDVAGQVRDAFTKGMSTAEEAFIQTALTGKFSFKEMTNSIHEDLLRFAVGGVKGALSKTLLDWIGDGTKAAAGASGGGGAGGGSMFSGLISGIGSLFAGVFHTGGEAGSPDVTRQISAAVFQNANRYHVGGVAGLRPGEVPAILEKGERVLTKSQTQNLADMLSGARNDNGTRSANGNSGGVTYNMPINMNFSGNVDKDEMRRSVGVAGQELMSTMERHRRRNG